MYSESEEYDTDTSAEGAHNNIGSAAAAAAAAQLNGESSHFHPNGVNTPPVAQRYLKK